MKVQPFRGMRRRQNRKAVEKAVIYVDPEQETSALLDPGEKFLQPEGMNVILAHLLTDSFPQCLHRDGAGLMSAGWRMHGDPRAW